MWDRKLKRTINARKTRASDRRAEQRGDAENIPNSDTTTNTGRRHRTVPNSGILVMTPSDTSQLFQLASHARLD